MKTYTVLLIDDHPIIADAYKHALLKVAADNEEVDFAIEMVTSCDAAIKRIEKPQPPIDLIFLDIKLPPSKDGQFVSGEDLGVHIRKVLPAVKIIVSTTYNENYRMNNILKSLKPNAFLVKSDINPTDLVTAIEDVLEDTPFYSKTVLKLFRNIAHNDFFLDKIDRQLLYELSIGTKTIDLPNILPLSRSGVEGRKRRLKELFNITKREDDKALIEAAKEKGFI